MDDWPGVLEKRVLEKRVLAMLIPKLLRNESGKVKIGAWFWLILATLYLPFREFLRAKQYSNADDFFRDILVWVIILGILIVPILSFILFKRRKRKEKLAAAGRSKASTATG